MISVLVLLWGVNFGNGFNIFPSLMTANATMAVVVDKSFFYDKDDYYYTLDVIFDLISDTVRKVMRVGGVTVRILPDNVTLHRDYTALLSVATCRRTWTLHEMAEKHDLLHLAITDQDCPRIPESVGMSIVLIKPGEELSQIFLDLRMADALSWNSINVVHDDGFDKDTIGRVLKAMSDEIPTKPLNLASRSIFTFKRIDSDRIRRRKIREQLAGLNSPQFGNCFLIIVNVDVVADVMEVAKSLQMMHPDSQWLYVIPDTTMQNSTNVTNFADLLAEGGNVAFIYNATNSDNVYDNRLLCRLEQLSAALAAALQYSLENEIDLFDRVDDDEFNIVRLTKIERRQEILKLIKDNFFGSATNSPGNCGKFLLWRISAAITWGNFFISSKTAHLIDCGSWTPATGLNLTDVIFPHVAHGFRGISLPIATYHNPPWQIISRRQTREAQYDGLTFEVVKYLSKKLNFTYTVLAVSDADSLNALNGSPKSVEKTSVLFGSTTRTIPLEVIDMVRANKVLMAACAYTVNDFGKATVNFTMPIFVQKYSFLTARPKQLSRALLFASPFTKETWACLAAAIIIMGPILYTIHKYSPRSTNTSGLNSSFQCVWYVYGALLQQGGMYLPRSDSARIIVGTWWLIVMVLVATYSGSLVAFLTFPKMDASILTVDDLLAHQDRLTWGFPNSSFLEEYLWHADEKYRVLLTRAERHNATQEDDVVRRIKEGKHVLVDWRSSLRFLMRKDLLTSGGCHFSLSTDEFMDEPIAMIVPRQSPYLPIINGELQRMHESGLMNKWILEKMPNKDKCWEITANDQMINKRKVNVADMQGIFFVLFMGVTLSVFMLCCEFYWHRRKVSKERKLIRPFVS